MQILNRKRGSIGDVARMLSAVAATSQAVPTVEICRVVLTWLAEILRDNPLLARLIEVDTKAPRRGLMSGETLRAPRQQLRRLRASAFDFALDFQRLLKSAAIARLSGARRIFGFSRDSLRKPASPILLSKFVVSPKNCSVIQKNAFLVEGALILPRVELSSQRSFYLDLHSDGSSAGLLPVSLWLETADRQQCLSCLWSPTNIA
jgi:ADP-heptose:LPS heptosyltransferase